MRWTYVTLRDDRLACCPICFALVQTYDTTGHEEWHGIDASKVDWREIREQSERDR